MKSCNNIENDIIYYMSKYIYKYTKKIEDDNILLKIATWNYKTKTKEFLKFIDWFGKRNIDNHFETCFREYIFYILYTKFNKKIAFNYIKDLDINKTSIEFFYKCMRRSAKSLYENSSSYNKDFINNIVKNTLRNIIPLNTMLNLIKNHNQDSENSSIVSYNYSDIDSSSSNNSININNNHNNVDSIKLELLLLDNIIEDNNKDKKDKNKDDNYIKKIKLKID